MSKYSNLNSVLCLHYNTFCINILLFFFFRLFIFLGLIFIATSISFFFYIYQHYNDKQIEPTRVNIQQIKKTTICQQK